MFPPSAACSVHLFRAVLVPCPNASMFLDSLVGDAAWRAVYAKNRQGDPLPWPLHAQELEATHPYQVFALRAMLAVPYFEKALCESFEKAAEVPVAASRSLALLCAPWLHHTQLHSQLSSDGHLGMGKLGLTLPSLPRRAARRGAQRRRRPSARGPHRGGGARRPRATAAALGAAHHLGRSELLLPRLCAGERGSCGRGRGARRNTYETPKHT